MHDVIDFFVVVVFFGETRSCTVLIINVFSLSQTQVGEGRVYKCLFNHKFEEAMSEKVGCSCTTKQKRTLGLHATPV